MDSQIYMTIIGLLIAFLALIISLYVEHRTRLFNQMSLERNAEHDHTKMVLDIDQMLVTYPELWAIYDDNPSAKNKSCDVLDVARREAFIYAHFNIMDLVYGFYHQGYAKKGKSTTLFSKSWEKYTMQFLRVSLEARNLFKEPRTQEIYDDEFVKYINGLIKVIEKQGSSK
jgi:hypothetical protein